MPKKADIGDREKEVLNTSLPYGVACNRFMKIGDELELRNRRDAFTRDKKKGFLISADDSYKSNETERFQMSPAGINKVLTQVIPDHIAQFMDCERKYNAFGSINGEARKRLKRLGDIQCYLYTMGVKDVYHVVADYYLDPFVFGYPENKETELDDINRLEDNTRSTRNNKIAPFYKYLISATVKAAKQCMPVTDESLVQCLFVANSQNPAIPQINDEQANTSSNMASKRYNNSSGILLDLSNRYAYVVFKAKPYVLFSWSAPSYERMLFLCSDVIGKIGIKNTKYGTNLINSAILLLETKGDLERKIRESVDDMRYSEPFYHIFPVLMQETQGQEFLDGILYEGLHKYLELSKQYAFQSIDGLFAYQNSVNEAKYRSADGTIYEDGTILDLYVMNSIKRKQEIGQDKFRLVCYESQLKLYCDCAGILEENIITIPDP